MMRTITAGEGEILLKEKMIYYKDLTLNSLDVKLQLRPTANHALLSGVKRTNENQNEILQ